MTEKQKANRKDPYTKLRERSARGDYELIEPLDYLLMEKLPEVGEMFAGLYPMGETVQNLSKKFPTPNGLLDTTTITNRMRALDAQGLTSHTRSAISSNGSKIWQRTAKGTDLVRKWKTKEKKNGNGES